MQVYIYLVFYTHTEQKLLVIKKTTVTAIIRVQHTILNLKGCTFSLTLYLDFTYGRVSLIFSHFADQGTCALSSALP